MPNLFGDDEEEESKAGCSSKSVSNGQPFDLKINANFAKRYESYREKEEYQTLKARLGSDDEEGGSSSEEEVGPDAIDDSQFLKVLTAIRQKDPSIYNKEVKFFESSADAGQTSAKKKDKSEKRKSKPLLLDEYERNVMLKGAQSEDSDDCEPSSKRQKTKAELSQEFLLYNEEQRRLREEFKHSIMAEPTSEEDDGSNLLVVKPDRVKKRKDKDPGVKNETLDPKTSVFSEQEKDLLKFILDKNLSDSEAEESEEEVEEEEIDERGPVVIEGSGSEDADGDESDSQFVEDQEKHEASYNFRFETPGGCEIKSFPRKVTETLRQPETLSRGEKRKELKAKRTQMEERRVEEIKRFKQLKKKEILEKIERIRLSAGVQDLQLDERDLESDFDPDKHDKMMEEKFNDSYYAQAGLDEDDEKPQFSDSDDHLESDANNENVNEENDLETILKTSAPDKPVFDPKVETFEQYLEKNYNIDFDDVIENEVSKAAVKTEESETGFEKTKFKFKYRDTTCDSFGLSVEELLGAPDRELNTWVSLKKASQYRERKDEMYDKSKFTKLAHNKFKKAKVFSSLYKNPEEVPRPNLPDSNSQSRASLLLSEIKFCADKKRRNRRRRKPEAESKVKPKDERCSKQKKNTSKTTGPSLSGVTVTDQRLKAYGIKNPKKFRHFVHHKAKSPKET